MPDQVCVIGAGVIGSLYAGHLARVTAVSVLCRRDAQAQALNSAGLQVSGKHDFTVPVSAFADSRQLPEFDLGILATKATDLEAAVAPLAGRFSRATMMTVQNGLGAEEIVRRYGDWQLVSAVTFMSGTRHNDRLVEYELDAPTWMGPYVGTSTAFARVLELEALLRDGGLVAEALPDLLPAQWSKLIFNSTVNAVCALTGLPHDQHFTRQDDVSDLGHLIRDLMQEGAAVATAAGIRLHDDPWEMNVRATSRGATERGAYRHLPSMLADVLAKRPTEIDFITGALVREANRLGVPVPLHTALYRLVKAKEASWQGATERMTELRSA